MSKLVPVGGYHYYSKRLWAIVDDEDYDRVVQHKWSPQYRKYTVHASARINDNRHVIYLHQFILELDGSVNVDHKDMDGLNCQKSNLRTATKSQNASNAPKRDEATTSVYKGVAFHVKANKWEAYIHHQQRKYYLGLHLTEEQAARVYDRKALELFGEFARLNFPAVELVIPPTPLPKLKVPT